jgi:polyribonucleotide nucleotidyltransferase
MGSSGMITVCAATAAVMSAKVAVKESGEVGRSAV